jgi:DnaJ-class molecular chaperone
MPKNDDDNPLKGIILKPDMSMYHETIICPGCNVQQKLKNEKCSRCGCPGEIERIASIIVGNVHEKILCPSCQTLKFKEAKCPKCKCPGETERLKNINTLE